MNSQNITWVVFAPPQTPHTPHKKFCGGKKHTTTHTEPFRVCVVVVVWKQHYVKFVKYLGTRKKLLVRGFRKWDLSTCKKLPLSVES